MGTVFKGKGYVKGIAKAPALITKERLGFLGFINAKKGIFSSEKTELFGESFKGKILIFTSGKAATGGARAIGLAVRAGNAPAAMVNYEIDPITVAGCAINDIPLLKVDDTSIFDKVKNGDIVTVDASRGEVSLGNNINNKLF